jgi:uncharacterized NAD(P)/FAD-binding protein YdhS
MSAWPDEPHHFADRFAAEGGDRRGFAQRRLFGRYLEEVLAEAVKDGRAHVIGASAVNAGRHEGHWRVDLDDGGTIAAQALVLAIGNQEPEGLRPFEHAGRRFIANPWGAAAREAVSEVARSGEDVLLVGTGLTMVDLVLSLDAAGYHGNILALSRRGLAPRSHADFAPSPVDAAEVPSGRVSAMARWLRKRSADVGWRAAIDSLRPHSHALWRSLGNGEQQRFLRHARPWWDVHRHRIAPEVAGTIAALVADGRLEIMAGRILAVSGDEKGLEVEFRRRGADKVRKERFGYAFNCTGPLHSMERSRDPLLRSLLNSGEVHPDQLGIGLAVDESSRAGERIWALGPLTKGRFWEIVAVPDIREQAAAVAEDIASELIA